MCLYVLETHKHHWEESTGYDGDQFKFQFCGNDGDAVFVCKYLGCDKTRVLAEGGSRSTYRKLSPAARDFKDRVCKDFDHDLVINDLAGFFGCSAQQIKSEMAAL